MQAKKQNALLAGLHFLLATAYLVMVVISFIDLTEYFDYMGALTAITTVAALVGAVFVFGVSSYMVGAYYLDMGSGKRIHGAIGWAVAGWTLIFLASLAKFINIVVEYQFVTDIFIRLLLTLLPLVITGVLYSKRHAMGSDLNPARISSVLYFMYLGLFYTIYDIASGNIADTAQEIITFVIRAILGLTITLSICYYYFKLGNTVQPQQYGPQNNYGYGPQQPYGQPYGQQNGPLQQFRQQNGYAAPVPPVQQAPVQQPVQPPVQQQAPVAKFCTSCGTPVDPNAAFCNNCGNKLH